MLLLQAHGMVEMRDLIQEVAEVLGGSGWRDTGNGAPPDERDVSRAVWACCGGASCGPWWTRARARLHDAAAALRSRHPGRACRPASARAPAAHGAGLVPSAWPTGRRCGRPAWRAVSSRCPERV